MQIDRRALMNAAWTIARRFAGNRETWGQRLSRALKSVWWSMKRDAELSAQAAARLAATAAEAARKTVADLLAEVTDLQNCDAPFGWAGIERLSTLRRELAQRAA
ncbi:hypothetical protein [Tabrizicola sp. M-4]|uniref:hypothetical protein n=1 Tax=Tabrizicola sp. M-4 TaxID=3055847 RepID=UPI003DA7FB81